MYRLYDVKNKKAIRARHVKFDESECNMRKMLVSDNAEKCNGAKEPECLVEIVDAVDYNKRILTSSNLNLRSENCFILMEP